jgi:hypothetical protein
MTRNEHIERILRSLAEGVGLAPDTPAFAPLRNLLFVLIDRAVREARRDITESLN